jgi:hypothetical protein
MDSEEPQEPAADTGVGRVPDCEVKSAVRLALVCTFLPLLGFAVGTYPDAFGYRPLLIGAAAFFIVFTWFVALGAVYKRHRERSRSSVDPS